jgi:hypothetical protein
VLPCAGIAPRHRQRGFGVPSSAPSRMDRRRTMELELRWRGRKVLGTGRGRKASLGRRGGRMRMLAMLWRESTSARSAESPLRGDFGVGRAEWPRTTADFLVSSYRPSALVVHEVSHVHLLYSATAPCSCPLFNSALTRTSSLTSAPPATDPSTCPPTYGVTNGSM